MLSLLTPLSLYNILYLVNYLLDKQMQSNKDLAIELQNVIGQLRRAGSFKHGHSKLRGAEKHALMLVAEINNGQPVTISEIANKMNVTLAAVTHQMNALERAGLIERLQDRDDRRLVFIKLSAKGKDQLAELRKEFSDKIKKLTDHLGEEDTLLLIHLIKRIAEYPGFNK